MLLHNRGLITRYLLLKWILVSLLHFSISQISCPDVAEFGSVIQLKFYSAPDGEITFHHPNDNLIATCSPGSTCVNEDVRFNATSFNTTLTYLQIRDVQKSDEGIWKGNQNIKKFKTNCTLILIETPSCKIESDKNTSYLVVDENITLSVNITDHYCSVPLDFMLQTGNIIEDLKMNHPVANVSGDVFNSTFKLSESHIGYLKLLFSCNNVHKSLACGELKSLLKKPPACNITSDKDTDELIVGEELSLSVYIEEYSCSRNTKFQLEIGKTTIELNRNNTGVNEEKIKFYVTESHFGPVHLNVTCNNISRNVQPVGIVRLQRRTTTTTSTTTTTTTTCKCSCPSGSGTGPSPTFIEKYLVVIIAVPIAGVALFIAVILICCYCVKPRCKSSQISRGYNDSCPYADVADNINSRPVTIRPDAYAEISDINGTFTNQAFDKDAARHNDGNHIILSGRSGDYVQKEAPQSYSTRALRADDLYSKVNKRTSTTSVSGQC